MMVVMMVVVMVVNWIRGLADQPARDDLRTVFEVDLGMDISVSYMSPIDMIVHNA